MNYQVADYTFSGLHSRGTRVDPITTLAYVIALVDGPKNRIVDMDKAAFVLRCLYDVEEQVSNAPELVSALGKYAPKRYFPQTPVMLTLMWSPISALLEQGWRPAMLGREEKGWACASGVWHVKPVEDTKPHEECETPEELFWSILAEVVAKARIRGLMLSVIAKPGWSYDYAVNHSRLDNLTLAEAKKADRVIWQRTPRQ